MSDEFPSYRVSASLAADCMMCSSQEKSRLTKALRLTSHACIIRRSLRGALQQRSASPAHICSIIAS